MKKLSALLVLFLLATAPMARAQAPGSAGPAQSQSRNVRFDIAINEAAGPRATVKTVVLMLTEPNTVGSIRNSTRLPVEPGARGTTVTDKDGRITSNPPIGVALYLNVDVRNVTFLPGDQIRASISVEYTPYLPNERVQPAAISGSAAMTFDTGKKATLLQTVDPVTDRKTTIDVTATIVK